MNYENLKGKALSENDILRLIDGKANLMTYNQLQKCKTLDEALGKDKALVLLYEVAPNYGHWTCVFDRNGTIEVFDSYGMYPDDEIDFVPKQFKKLNYKKLRYLSKLLYESKKRIEYNEVPLQSDEEGISTCGRWVIVRLIYRDVPQNKFADFFKKYDDPDLLVTYATEI